MKQRIITAIVLLIIFVPCLIIGKIPFAVLVFLLGLGAAFELLSICDFPKTRYYMYPAMALYIELSIFKSADLTANTTFLIAFMIFLLACGIFDSSMPIDRICYYFTSGTLVAFGIHMLYYMRVEQSLVSVIFLAFATLGADTGAYFVGRAIGKRKLCERLSPKKTIEGSIGGIVIGSALAIVFNIFVPLKMNWLWVVITAVVLASTGQIGDLTFSAIKRHFEVKDYSQIFPGHGGVLDRFDSIIFNAFVYGFMLQLYYALVVL